MKRRNFLKDCLMGLAISLVPKILQPSLPELLEDELVAVDVQFQYSFPGIIPEIKKHMPIQTFTVMTTKELALFIKMQQ